MERSDRADLPGNDASWYRALLVEQIAAVATEPEPGQQTSTVVSPESSEDSTLEPVVKSPQLSGDTDPVHFPAEDDDATSPDEPDSPDTEVPDVSGDLAAPETQTEAAVDSTKVAAVPDQEPEDALATTSEMVGQLWTSQATSGPLDDWEPDEMDRKITSSRPFRWTSVIAVLAVIGLIVVGLVLLPSLTRSRANDHRDMMVAALWELRSELPDTQTSLQTATEPSTTVSALNDLSTQLTALAARASDVDDAGSADLPSAPPLTSTDPIDELVPIQQRLEPLATTASTIQRRIGNLVEYRSLMSGFLALPDLPTEADSATQTDLRVVLASAQAQSASILSDLPSDVSLSAHQDLARTINEFFADWQIDYLEALRTQDATTAANLVTDLQRELSSLDEALVTPLAQIRRQTDTDLIDLARAIDEVLSLANGETPAT